MHLRKLVPLSALLDHLSAGASAKAELAGAVPASARTIDPDDPKRDLKAEAMSSSAVQAVLDVFPAEIRDVEEM